MGGVAESIFSRSFRKHWQIGQVRRVDGHAPLVPNAGVQRGN